MKNLKINFTILKIIKHAMLNISQIQQTKLFTINLLTLRTYQELVT